MHLYCRDNSINSDIVSVVFLILPHKHDADDNVKQGYILPCSSINNDLLFEHPTDVNVK